MPKLSKEYREALEARLRRDVCRAVFGIIGKCSTEDLGIDIFSMKEIARRAGVATGTLYNHFGNKDGLVAAMIEDAFAEYRRKETQIVEAAMPAADKPRALCEALLEVPPEAHRVTYIMTISRQVMPAVQKQFDLMGRRGQKALTRIMQQGLDEGLFGETSPGELLAGFASPADTFVESGLHWQDTRPPKKRAAIVVDFFCTARRPDTAHRQSAYDERKARSLGAVFFLLA